MLSNTQSSLFVCFLGALLTISYSQEVLSSGGAGVLNPLPGNLLNIWSASMFQRSQYSESLNVLPVRGRKEESLDQIADLPLKKSGSPLNFVRITSPYPFDVDADADSLRLSADTLCTTKAVRPDENKQWKCFSNKKHGHAEIDILLPETKEAKVFIATNQAVTVHYPPLSNAPQAGTGQSTDPLSVHINQEHALKQSLSKQLRDQEKVQAAIQRASGLLKVSLSNPSDDSALQTEQAIAFKLIHGLSQEEEQEFKDQIEKIRSGEQLNAATNPDLVLAPDTSIHLENLNVIFSGLINSLPVDGGTSSSGNNQGKSPGDGTSNASESSRNSSGPETSAGKETQNSSVPSDKPKNTRIQPLASAPGRLLKPGLLTRLGAGRALNNPVVMNNSAGASTGQITGKAEIKARKAIQRKIARAMALQKAVKLPRFFPLKYTSLMGSYLFINTAIAVYAPSMGFPVVDPMSFIPISTFLFTYLSAEACLEGFGRAKEVTKATTTQEELKLELAVQEACLKARTRRSLDEFGVEVEASIQGKRYVLSDYGKAESDCFRRLGLDPELPLTRHDVIKATEETAEEICARIKSPGK
ncbi:hypothetical protein [Endozoicomonas euniceicola]|uniref:Uncharacterized protein n=1 Tax=Endozoicomonas euniceicola TaxID=1234143 RepID=A0ABY6GPC8_9GAMM|nr:hypothetical protein [Endozoicomonas euniceicola]UYM14613.1 hypothetical protein NX720_17175 [Endozoicomonas euniceicola]